MHVLAHSDYQPSTMVDTTPGSMHIGNKVVKDIHNYGVLDLTQVIEKSSNVYLRNLEND